jgi:putative ABC transport system ATP-binding protein
MECHRSVADIAKIWFEEGRSREEDMSALIEVRDMYKIYNPGENEVRALDGVSLTVDEGEFVAIIGQSGSGKSTLMNMLGCLDVPTKGTYILNGKDVSSLSDNELSEVRNNDIGFIFQGFNLIQNLTALENVELPLIYRRVEKSRRRRLAIEALQKVGLEERMKHKPAEMSGGQQQRVAIARAIAAAPPLILADEPTGNLDSKSTRDIMRILDGLNDQGNTIVLITHDDGIAANAKRVVRIMDGKIESDTVKADMEEEKVKPAEQTEEAIELREISGAMSEDNRE